MFGAQSRTAPNPIWCIWLHVRDLPSAAADNLKPRDRFITDSDLPMAFIQSFHTEFHSEFPCGVSFGVSRIFSANMNRLIQSFWSVPKRADSRRCAERPHSAPYRNRRNTSKRLIRESPANALLDGFCHSGNEHSPSLRHSSENKMLQKWVCFLK